MPADGDQPGGAAVLLSLWAAEPCSAPGLANMLPVGSNGAAGAGPVSAANAAVDAVTMPHQRRARRGKRPSLVDGTRGKNAGAAQKLKPGNHGVCRWGPQGCGYAGPLTDESL